MCKFNFIDMQSVEEALIKFSVVFELLSAAFLDYAVSKSLHLIVQMMMIIIQLLICVISQCFVFF